MRLVIAIGVLAATPAEAGPTLRVGTTFAYADSAIESRATAEVGPTVGLGYRLRPILVELDYAYLGYDMLSSVAGSHRLGFALRTELASVRDAASRARLELDLGAAYRRGRWSTGDDELHGRELHAGLAATIGAAHVGWLFGLRYVGATWDTPAIACRGACANDNKLVDHAFMGEVSFHFE